MVEVEVEGAGMVTEVGPGEPRLAEAEAEAERVERVVEAVGLVAKVQVVVAAVED